MPPVGFEPTISAGERLQTYALDRAATGIGTTLYIYYIYYKQCILYIYIYKQNISINVAFESIASTFSTIVITKIVCNTVHITHTQWIVLK